jgi:hypothetical protein
MGVGDPSLVAPVATGAAGLVACAEGTHHDHANTSSRASAAAARSLVPSAQQ